MNSCLGGLKLSWPRGTLRQLYPLPGGELQPKEMFRVERELQQESENLSSGPIPAHDMGRAPPLFGYDPSTIQYTEGRTRSLRSFQLSDALTLGSFVTTLGCVASHFVKHEPPGEKTLLLTSRYAQRGCWMRPLDVIS